MDPATLVLVLIALAVLNLLGLLLLWLRRIDAETLRRQGDSWREAARGDSDRLARDLREEVQGSARGTRQELATSLSGIQLALLTQSGDVARTQNEQIEAFRIQLATMQQQVAQGLHHATGSLAAQTQSAREAQDAALRRFGDGLAEQLRALGEGNERRLGEVRTTVEAKLAQVQAAVDQRLTAIQADNEKQLEQMRATVDEKLQTTLQARLGESFRQVAERLEQVHRGLGEMQTLAQGVGDLRRVLTNVKTRGVFGEIQLAALLEQVFTPEQYAANVATVPGSNERVEFALRLPGRGAAGGGEAPVWLPMDAKFPREDYERLMDAQDRAERDEAEAAARALEVRIRDEARSIAAKYLAPPHTTDFAVLFVPTEGLFAELLRRPGLFEALQRQHRVTLAGPTTLLAMLNSLQMGFRTLALEQRSSEVWKVLGAVKTEFGRFGEALARTKKKLEEAGSHIESVERRSRAMNRELRQVEALPRELAPDAAPGVAGRDAEGAADPDAASGHGPGEGASTGTA
jgi:DNA recombination protein RmuC